MFVHRIGISLVYGNPHAFVCVGKDWRTAYRTWSKLHIERVWSTNEYAYVVSSRWSLQKIFHILGKGDDGGDDGWDCSKGCSVENSLVRNRSWNIGCSVCYRRRVVKPESARMRWKEEVGWLASIISIGKGRMKNWLPLLLDVYLSPIFVVFFLFLRCYLSNSIIEVRADVIKTMPMPIVNNQLSSTQLTHSIRTTWKESEINWTIVFSPSLSSLLLSSPLSLSLCIYVYDSITEDGVPCVIMFFRPCIVYRWDAKEHQAIPATNTSDALLVFSRYILLIVTHSKLLLRRRRFFLTRHSKMDDNMSQPSAQAIIGRWRCERRSVRSPRSSLLRLLIHTLFSSLSNYHWVPLCACKHDESSRTTSRVREHRRVNPPSPVQKWKRKRRGRIFSDNN